MANNILSTKEKALRLNLDPSIYGTIAEIGGGQEVARNFFQAGGASGTIAKTISAYDKTFSDYNYDGASSGRYVSKERIGRMLDKEFGELAILLGSKKPRPNLFAFANTMETLNYHKTNRGHGWLGIRFEKCSVGRPNEILIHIKLHENDCILQQYTVGTIGINLIWAAFNNYDSPNTFLRTLMDNLDRDRVEVDFVSMKGPELDYIDNRLLGVQLVKNGMTPAIMFDRYGEVHQPGDLLYKKNILAFRGSFRPITYVGIDMLKSSYSIFKTDKEHTKENTITFCEITLNNLTQEGDIDERDFLERVDILNGMGQNVMITDFEEFYKLADYFCSFRIKKLRLIIGALTFEKLFDKSYYKSLRGGIMEAFGKLFKPNTKVYVYPALYPDSQERIDSTKLERSEDLEFLYKYLVQNRKIIDIKHVKEEWLSFFPHQVIDKIINNDRSWEKMVPKCVSKQIKKNKLFGFREELQW